MLASKLLMALAFVPIPLALHGEEGRASSDSYIVKAATVPDAHEGALSALYDQSRMLRLGDRLPAFDIPATAVTKNDTNWLIEHSFYVTQNERRGFSFAIPLSMASLVDQTLRVSASSVTEINARQGITVIVLQ